MCVVLYENNPAVDHFAYNHSYDLVWVATVLLKQQFVIIIYYYEAHYVSTCIVCLTQGM